MESVLLQATAVSRVVSAVFFFPLFLRSRKWAVARTVPPLRLMIFAMSFAAEPLPPRCMAKTAAFLPDYALPSSPESAAGTSLSGIAGAGITFVFAAATGIAITKAKKRKKARANV